jgi:type I restriction enzyme, R subunit
MNEDQLEQHCLEWFRANNWEVEYGPDIAPDSDKPERRDYREKPFKAV